MSDKKFLVLNIGCFPVVDKWFVKDYLSAHHFFQLFENSQVFSRQFDSVDASKTDITNFCDEFIAIANTVDISLLCICIHGHGSYTEDWQLQMGNESLTGSSLILKFEPLFTMHKTLYIMNSCNARQDVMGTKIKSEIPPIASISDNYFLGWNYFGGLKPFNFINKLQLDPKEFVIPISSKLGENYVNNDLPVLTIDNIAFFKREDTKHLYLFSISENYISAGFNPKSSGFTGSLFNILSILNNKMIPATIYKLLDTYLNFSDKNYDPVLNIYTSNILEAISEFHGSKVDFSENIVVEKNKLLNTKFYDELEKSLKG